MNNENNQMYMMVVENIKGENLKSVVINLKDVDFIESENRRIVYYIGDKKYYQIMNLNEMQTILENKDEAFVSLDRNNLVNLRKVKDFDETLGKVYFSKIENRDNNKTYATIARIKNKVYAPLLKRYIAKNLDTQLTHSYKVKNSPSCMREQENI
jgi:DNA-binding LytR/AlgR family response regulator